MKTDKDYILSILEILRKGNGHCPYHDKDYPERCIPKEYWEKNKDKSNQDYWKDTIEVADDDTWERLKIALERNGLVTPHPYQPYSFMITAFGLRIIRENNDWLNDKGNLGFLYKIMQYDLPNWVVILGMFPVIASILEIIKSLHPIISRFIHYFLFPF